MCSVAIVFGGTKGIGRAVAAKLLSSGFSVAVASREKANVAMATDKLGELANKLHVGGDAKHSKMNVGLFGIECDVTDESSVQSCFAAVVKQLSTPEIVVNAAGINEDKLLVRSNIANTRTILDTNLLGAICTSKEAIRHMIKSKSGTIINIGSVVGIKGNTGQTAYAASKSGLIGFTKSLAKEVGPKNIRVNLVVPGFIDTDMTANLSNLEQIRQTIPMRRLGTPKEVAEVVHFLSMSPYITGQNADTVWCCTDKEPYRLASKRAYILHKRLRKMMNFSAPPMTPPPTVAEVIPRSRLATCYGKDIRYDEYEGYLAPVTRQHPGHHPTRMPSWNDISRVVAGAERLAVWGSLSDTEPWQHPVVDIICRSLQCGAKNKSSKITRSTSQTTTINCCDDGDVTARPDITSETECPGKPDSSKSSRSLEDREEMDGEEAEAYFHQRNTHFAKKIRLSVQCERLLYISDSDVEREPTTRLRIKVKKICRRQTKKFLQRISSPDVRGLWTNAGVMTDAAAEAQLPAPHRKSVVPSGGRPPSKTPRPPFYPQPFVVTQPFPRFRREPSGGGAPSALDRPATSWTATAPSSIRFARRSYSDESLSTSAFFDKQSLLSARRRSSRPPNLSFRKQQHQQQGRYNHPRPPQQLVCLPREAASRPCCAASSDTALHADNQSNRTESDVTNTCAIESSSSELAHPTDLNVDDSYDPEILSNFRAIEQNTLSLIDELQQQLDNTSLHYWKSPTKRRSIKGENPQNQNIPSSNFIQKHNFNNQKKYSPKMMAFASADGSLTSFSGNAPSQHKPGIVAPTPRGTSSEPRSMAGPSKLPNLRLPRPLLARSAAHDDQVNATGATYPSNPGNPSHGLRFECGSAFGSLITRPPPGFDDRSKAMRPQQSEWRHTNNYPLCTQHRYDTRLLSADPQATQCYPDFMTTSGGHEENCPNHMMGVTHTSEHERTPLPPLETCNQYRVPQQTDAGLQQLGATSMRQRMDQDAKVTSQPLPSGVQSPNQYNAFASSQWHSAMPASYNCPPETMPDQQFATVSNRTSPFASYASVASFFGAGTRQLTVIQQPPTRQFNQQTSRYQQFRNLRNLIPLIHPDAGDGRQQSCTTIVAEDSIKFLPIKDDRDLLLTAHVSQSKTSSPTALVIPRPHELGSGRQQEVSATDMFQTCPALFF